MPPLLENVAAAPQRSCAAALLNLPMLALRAASPVILVASVLVTEILAADLAPFRRCGTPSPSIDAVRRLNALLETRAREYRPQAANGSIGLAFHVIHSGTTGNVTDADIATQIAVLNGAFLAWGYSFILTSIDRTDNPTWFTMDLNNDGDAKNALSIDPVHRLNFYTCQPPGDSLLGWAHYPDSHPEDSKQHGVVVDWRTLPGGGFAGYNLGDTGVHEVGHYLGLYHTFENGCAGSGDSVDDTPFEHSAADTCLEGRDTCPEQPGVDPIHNFMDYSDDACMTHFTAGQDARMEMMVEWFKPNLLIIETPALRLTNLGTLGGTLTIARDINDSGHIVGGSEAPSGLLRPFLWIDGKMTDLGSLEPATAYGINSFDEIVGSTVEGQSGAFRWSNGSMEMLPFGHSAFGMSDSGLAVGYGVMDTGLDAIAWGPSGATMLPFPPNSGFTFSAWASSVNASGVVVGAATRIFGNLDAFPVRWVNGVGQYLPIPIGHSSQTNPMAKISINDSGYIVGGLEPDGAPGRIGLRWAPNGDTLTLPMERPRDINDVGVVVGSHQGRAVLWDKGTLIDLNEAIPGGSGWVLQSAEAINSLGEIVGFGTLDGDTMGFLLEADPGPPTAVQTSLVSAEAEPGRVRVRWHIVEGREFTVYRRQETDGWMAIAGVVADANGLLAYEDRNVVPGTRYGYRLGRPDTESVWGEVWVVVPADFALALHGSRPNPSHGAWAVGLSIPTSEPAVLEVFDVSGRRHFASDLRDLSPGNHVFQVEPAHPLPSGLYLLRLTQAGRSVTTKAVVTR